MYLDCDHRDDASVVYIALVLRKWMLEVKKMKPFENHEEHIISFVNAVSSKNIEMMSEEVQHYESIYINNAQNVEVQFKTHPFAYMNTLVDKEVELMRRIVVELEKESSEFTWMQQLNFFVLNTEETVFRECCNRLYK